MSEVGATGAAGATVEVAAGWSDADLDAVLASDAPRLQPVLDRDGRRVSLAAWPDGCRRLADDADAGTLTRLLDEFVDGLAGPLRSALAPRMRASAWVCTPAGEWMLALDDLLAR